MPASPLVRASLTLLAGGAAAQVLPLALGPLLTRLYAPSEFGVYHLLAAVAANLGVVACARYEFALPLARDDAEAHALGALARWILLATTALAAVAGIGWSLAENAIWPLWLPAAVAALGGLSLATLTATRAQRFRSMALARVLHQGGGAVLQAAGSGAGVAGLIGGSVLGALGAALALRVPQPRWWREPRAALRQAAIEHRDFPLLNTPHAFTGALQDTLSLALIAAWLGPAAAGFWGLALRYLKAPVALIGSAVSQALYPALATAGAPSDATRADVRRVMGALALLALPLVLVLWAFGPWLFGFLFGAAWAPAGDLARALALYIGVHFIASPLGVVTLAWRAQGWALRIALLGQAAFVAALAAGLWWGGLGGAGWCVSGVMTVFFGLYFWRLAHWPA